MKIKITVTIDVGQKNIAIESDPRIPPVDAAILLTQATTGLLAQAQAEQGLIINPNNVRSANVGKN